MVDFMKKKNIELKIYELLGIKTFKKMAFSFRNLLSIPSTKKMTKEEKNNFLYNTPSNYIMKKGNGFQDLKDFKKMLRLNALTHILGSITCIFFLVFSVIDVFINPISIISIASIIIQLVFFIVNLYCVMLQRYNWIRINKTIKRMKPREEKKKNELKAELQKTDTYLAEHSYKIVKNKKIEKDISLEELMENASLRQLKQYRDYLEKFCQCNNVEFKYEYKCDIGVPIAENKTLKLKFKEIDNKDSK